MGSLITADHVGLVRERQQQVTRERTAVHIGSGSLGVYATPAMLAFVESTSREFLDELLDDAHTTVGTFVSLKHLAPTPEGESVNLRVEISSVEGRRVELHAELWDKVEKIGEVTHHRAVIEVERFMKRVNTKKN
ncbi:MAG: thioesterase family protein [Anaerolineales bacterium]|jgi:predicted thioesterase